MTKKFEVRHTKVWADLQTQVSAGRKRSALITDIDNTWYRADDQDAVQAAWELRERASAAPYPIIAVTGAGFNELVWRRIKSGELPRPEVLVSGVGSDIRFLSSENSFIKDEEYDAQLRETGFRRSEVLLAIKGLLPRLRADGAEISFQEPEKEAACLDNHDPDYQPYKVSLHFLADEAGVQSTAVVFGREFPRFKIVICEEIYHNAALPSDALRKKYCLDVVAANKAFAVNYLTKKLGLERGVVAGDSGNDIDMLLDTPVSFMAVAVGGHKLELKAALEAHKAAKKTQKLILIDTHGERLGAQTLLCLDGYIKGGQKEYL